jgi:hypothetical protein
MLSTRDVVESLRREGFDLSIGYLQFLWRERHLLRPDARFGDAFAWTDADVDRLRSVLRRRGRGPQQ